MSNLRLIYDNKWRKGTILTPSSEDFKHPAEDTQVDTKEQYYKAASKTSPCTVPNDLGTALPLDFVAILGHNFEPSGVTIEFQGDDNSDFSSPTTKTLTYNAENIFQFFTEMTERYVRIRLTKGSDFTNYPQFATVITGKAWAPSRNIGLNYADGAEDFTDKDYGQSRVLFSQERPILDTGRYPFRALNNTDQAEIMKFLKEVGTHHAWVLCFDKDAANTKSWFVLNSELVAPTFIASKGIWSWELSIEEAK